MKGDTHLHAFLLHGYIRQNYIDKELPNEIIELLFKWYHIDRYAIKYEQTLDLLLNYDCFVGVYDFKFNVWRSAIYLNKWDTSRAIMIRYMQNNKLSHKMNLDIFATLKYFPINYVVHDPVRFETTELDLRDYSNLPKENIDAWVKRKKENKN